MMLKTVTSKIILANIIAFFIGSLLLLLKLPIDFIALRPSSVLAGKYVWTIFTSIWMHGGFLHLFVNMFSLLFIGSFVERLVGSKRFFRIFLISGIVGSLLFVFLSALFPGPWFGYPSAAAVGASGAIFGLGGMLAVLTPKLPVYIMLIPIPMPMWFGITFMLIVFWLLSAFAGLPIGNAAHLGGFLAGLAYAIYLRKRYKRRARAIARYFR